MTLTDQWGWRGDTPVVRSATRYRFGGTANLEAFTDTRWVTVRGDIAPCPGYR